MSPSSLILYSSLSLLSLSLSLSLTQPPTHPPSRPFFCVSTTYPLILSLSLSIGPLSLLFFLSLYNWASLSLLLLLLLFCVSISLSLLGHSLVLSLSILIWTWPCFLAPWQKRSQVVIVFHCQLCKNANFPGTKKDTQKCAFIMISRTFVTSVARWNNKGQHKPNAWTNTCQYTKHHR